MIYPGSSPEFRILLKPDGTQVFQVRYVCDAQKYKSPWQDVPIVEETK